MRRPRAVTLPVLYPRRALVVGSVLALAVGPVALAPAPGPTPPPAATTPAGDRGTQLYLEQCASCHGVRGQGSQQGPSLVGVGPAAVDFQLSTGRMPVSREVSQARRREPVFSAGDISALVDHVGSFGGGGPRIPRVTPGDVVSGREIFAANCAPCHGATGSGAVLTNGWSAPPLYDASATQVAEAVRVGPGLMPAFPAQVLTDQQVDDLTSYVRRLRTEGLDPGGNPLGRLGPLAEGLLAWLVVLGLLVAGVRWLGGRAAE